jgi:5-methyltetrahydropteroyltriglutamate--homocysteine methyltransferase
VPIDLLALLKGKDVLVGAIDVANDAIETPEEVATTIRAALQFVAPESSIRARIAEWSRCRARLRAAKMQALAAGAALVRQQLNGA